MVLDPVDVEACAAGLHTRAGGPDTRGHTGRAGGSGRNTDKALSLGNVGFGGVGGLGDLGQETMWSEKRGLLIKYWYVNIRKPISAQSSQHSRTAGGIECVGGCTVKHKDTFKYTHEVPAKFIIPLKQYTYTYM